MAGRWQEGKCKLKTPAMHASFECEAYEDPEWEQCAHRQAESWALAKGCADALQAPGSSRPRPRHPHQFLALQAKDEEPRIVSQKVCIAKYKDGAIPPHIKRIREEGMRKYSPLDYQMPNESAPENTVFRAWARKWLIKRSELMPGAGMGLFAGELVFVKVTPDDRHAVPLFPYIGPRYTTSEYEAIADYYPNLKKYAVHMQNCSSKSKGRDKENWVIVGSPRDDHNLAGYINSNNGKWEANCMLEVLNRPTKNKVDDPWMPYSRDHDRKAYPFLDKLNSCQNPKYMKNYVMVVAKKPLHVGDELIIDYPRDQFC